MINQKFINETFKNELKVFHEKLDLLLHLIKLANGEDEEDLTVVHKSIIVHVHLLKTYCDYLISWEEREEENERAGGEGG